MCVHILGKLALTNRNALGKKKIAEMTNLFSSYPILFIKIIPLLQYTSFYVNYVFLQEISILYFLFHSCN